ncbi:MAG TPA: ABC transporter permease [Terriglobales bacterium]|jgi:putative ABC transport system permease protein|nr:ABC transporter permease [Terriglobales bacterium]
MFFRLIYQSFYRQRRNKLLAGIAIVFGVAVATAMIAVATDIGDKMNRELRAYGPNIVVYPQEETLGVEIGGVNLKPITSGAFLKESDLPKLKGIFWGHSITGFAPFLSANVNATIDNGTAEARSSTVPVELIGTYFSKTIHFGKDDFVTGVRNVYPWWRVQGAWPQDDPGAKKQVEVLTGIQFANDDHLKVGDILRVGDRELRISGILNSGGAQDRALVGPLALAQEIVGRPDAVREVYISALTKPEDALARRNPSTMSPAMHDRWYCSPYANSIAFQINEALPYAHAEQIRQVAQNEGSVLSRINGLMWLVTLAALLAAVLAVSAAMMNTLMARRREIGLMKALGATRTSVAALFLAEGAMLAIVGGGAGFMLGIFLAQRISLSIFGSAIHVEAALFPVVLLVSFLILLLGSAFALQRAARLDPTIVLRGDA